MPRFQESAGPRSVCRDRRGRSRLAALSAAFEFVRVTDLHAFYGESHILHGIDFVVNRGEVVTLSVATAPDARLRCARFSA